MKVNICIVTFPLSKAGCTPLSNLVKLFSRLANKVYVISSGVALDNLSLEDNIQKMEVAHKDSSKAFMRIFYYMHTQLKILRCVIAILRKTDLFLFFIGGEGLFVPMLALKLLRKKVVLMLGGVGARALSIKKDPLSKFMSLLVSINLSMADKLIVYSHTLTQEANLAKYQRKIITAHEHFVDFTKFTVKKKIDERNVVGYIGRLSEEKGILNLIEAMPLVLKKTANACFIIWGEGSLADEAEQIIKSKGLEAHVELTGWITHEDVPHSLNKLKLLVIPSFTEGLPNILLEAMACGTPILATPAGAIPDIIKDGKSGFLLKSNDPKHIAERTVELLDRPELLEKVSVNAYRYVRENFSYAKTLEAWRRIFSELGLL